MIKVTLLGDSIRMIGYGTAVPALLGNEFEVFQPNDNCRFAKYTLRGLFEWEKDMRGSRIVHWNNGLWDICDLYGDGPFTPEAEYTDNMSRIADILLSRYDKVIFSTTTPVTDRNRHSTNSAIKRYNDMIVPVLEKKGVLINDLYGILINDVDRYIRKDDNIHLTYEAIKVCAEKVAGIIRAASRDLGPCGESAETLGSASDGAPV